MSKSLQAFLNPVRIENKEVIVSNRFVEDGKVVPFVIKPITQKENELLIKKYTKMDKKGNQTFNQTEYVQALTASAVVFPDLNNAELQKTLGALGNVDALKELLYVGEFSVLTQEVQKLSGLDVEDEELIEEAKN
ncbi:phage portal protein [Sporanaerobium hydrogeniformans]|uniref:Phage portal protein n=1 Tax=Sporanaerobium hydrogeniformans TaxID=3072179 RepID=A0AC61DHX2_9FIRM|nr:phage portal protein [Sporanaerobium hydrogeniformans]PHV72186.1 phage portal protein [Sporanaerobium hydrogeniformans]